MDAPENHKPTFEALIAGEMREVLKYRQNTWEWVSTPHTIKDTEKRLKELQAMSNDISQIALELVAHKGGMTAEEKAADNNFRAIELVRSYERDIKDCLTVDRDALKKAATDEKIDYIKNITFLFGIPIGFVASVKNGVGNGQVDANDAMIVGFAVSIPTVFHKSIKAGFKAAAKEIREAPATLRAIPASIGNDIRVVYAREVIKEKTNNAQLCFSVAAKAVNDNVGVARSRMMVGVRKLFGRNSPHP